MIFCVGSTNPVKINGVRQAVEKNWPEAKVVGYDVPSGVSPQPSSDQETRRGAEHRAHAALRKGEIDFPNEAELIGVGLEGGVFQPEDRPGELWSTVWASVTDRSGKSYPVNGMRLKLPERVAEPILQGEEMGPVMEKISGISDVRKHQGMIGIITKDLLSRTEEYGSLAKLAVGLWYGRDWDKNL